MNSAAAELVPEKLNLLHAWPSWPDFFAACALYDPPVPGLVEFAERMTPRGGEVILSPYPGAKMLQKFMEGERTEEPRKMVLPPIKQLPNPQQERADASRHYGSILKAFWDVHVKPLGISFNEALSAALRSETFQNEVEGQNNNKPRDDRLHYYLEIDEYTTEEDVRRTFRMLTAVQPKRPRASRPARDRLTCVECAVLHDHCGWTYEQLAERFGWTDFTRASKYIKDGRAILGE